MLTRDDILKKVDLERFEVEVPQWGGSVLCRTLSHGEQTHLWSLWRRAVPEDPAVAAGADGKGTATPTVPAARDEGDMEMAMVAILPYVVSRACMHENGDRLFTDSDVPELMQKNREALKVIYDEVLKRSNAGAGEAELEAEGKDSALTQ